MANSAYSTIISVNEAFREGEYWVLTSDQLPGLLLSGKNLTELRADIPNVIRLLFKMNYDLEIEVRPIVDAKALLTRREKECFAVPSQYSAIPRAA